MTHHWKDAVKLVYVGHYYSAQQKFYVHIYEGKKLFLLAENTYVMKFRIAKDAKIWHAVNQTSRFWMCSLSYSYSTTLKVSQPINNKLVWKAFTTYKYFPTNIYYLFDSLGVQGGGEIGRS